MFRACTNGVKCFVAQSTCDLVLSLVMHLQACHWAIDELKAMVPIWKKETYEGGEVWKENAESRNLKQGGFL